MDCFKNEGFENEGFKNHGFWKRDLGGVDIFCVSVDKSENGVEIANRLDLFSHYVHKIIFL